MRLLIDLDEKVLEKVDAEGKTRNRKRKNMIEFIIIERYSPEK